MPAYLSKYQDGMTWREAKEARRKAREMDERTAKAEAKASDGGRCRWPGCDCRQRRLSVEMAHVAAKGMGGTPDGRRNDPRNLITLDIERHRTGRKSLHSGDLKIVALTEDGTRGPCEFWSTDDLGQPYLVAREREPFIYERD